MIEPSLFAAFAVCGGEVGELCGGDEMRVLVPQELRGQSVSARIVMNAVSAPRSKSEDQLVT